MQVQNLFYFLSEQQLNRAWLTSIAQNYKSDWKPILTALGLTPHDIQQIENSHPGNLLEQAISALILWRDRTASEGYQVQYQNLMNAIDNHVKAQSAQPQQPLVHTVTDLGNLFFLSEKILFSNFVDE